MSLNVIAFAVLAVIFIWGTFTRVNAGVIAFAAAFIFGPLVFDVSVKEVIGGFPSSLFFTLMGATLLFAIVKVTGTIQLMSDFAERLAHGRRRLIPVLMFLLITVLCAAGAFTPAAVAIVAPVALELAHRFKISRLAMGFVIVNGANAGAFSPTNPFGVISNQMLQDAGLTNGAFPLMVATFAFNALLAFLSYVAANALARAIDKGKNTEGMADVATQEERVLNLKPTLMQVLTLVSLAVVLVLTLFFSVDVGVGAIILSLVLITIDSSIQKKAFDAVPWSAVLLVTGIVTYVNLLSTMGAIDALQEGIAAMGSGSTAALVTSYVVAAVSTFASTTGTLGTIAPITVSIAADPMVSALGTVIAVSIASAAVDSSPMSTAGALLITNAPEGQEKLFFRALIGWAILMVAVVPLAVWFIFVETGLF
ncbi:SLC13 family permease [Schaalia vaccimaxillae]|uniref:SLC13 family permease n=1 Tax=Schaalia vaccimaxillae TaxID=183916 RepID=UPI0003B5855F|nr:SLC13 family permease [Schaalia vaccimaxillae]